MRRFELLASQLPKTEKRELKVEALRLRESFNQQVRHLHMKMRIFGYHPPSGASLLPRRRRWHAEAGVVIVRLADIAPRWVGKL